MALDVSCDHAPGLRSLDINSTIQMHTSNTGRIRTTVGGVGHNVALAAHLVSNKSDKPTVQLHSLVVEDL